MKGMNKMKHRNYVKYSQMNKEEQNEVVIDKPSFDNVEGLENNVEEIINNEENSNVQNEEPKQPEPIPAVVVGCAKLRVRREPSANAGVYGTVDEGTELTIDNGEESYEDFYKVYTVINDTLIEGYCMKKFIKLK